MHLADSALPTGGYAFSNGVEGAYQLGLLESSKELEEFVLTVLTAAAYGEVPFIHSCYMDLGESAIAEMLHFYDAMVTAPAMRRASLTLGKNWLRLVADLYPEAAVADLRRRLIHAHLPAHYTAVLALSLKAVGFSQIDVQQLFMYCTLRDQISAAVRLGVIGSMEANRRQLQLYPRCRDLLAAVAGRSYRQATRCAPQMDLAQNVHDALYSRLFQS